MKKLVNDETNKKQLLSDIDLVSIMFHKNPDLKILYLPVIDNKANMLLELFNKMGITSNKVTIEPEFISGRGNLRIHGDIYNCSIIPPMFYIDMDNYLITDYRKHLPGVFYHGRFCEYPLQAVEFTPNIINIFREFNGLKETTPHYLHSTDVGSTMYIEQLHGSISEQWSQLNRHENSTGYLTDWCDEKPEAVKISYACDDDLEDMFHYHM